MKRFLFAILFTCLLNTAFSQRIVEPDSTAVIIPDEPALYFPMDRPSQSFNAKTAAKNMWILQMGVNWGWLLDASRYDYKAFQMPVNVRYGVTDKLEVMLSPTPSFGTPVGRGAGIEYSLSSWNLALRYSLFKNKKAGNMALLGSYTYFNYERGQTHQDQFSVKILYSIPLGRYITLGTNVGYLAAGIDTDQFTYTLIANVALTKKFGFYVETYGGLLIDAFPIETNPSFFDAGVYFLARPFIQFDAGYGQGSSSSFQNNYTFVGMSYLFGQR